MNDSIHYKNPPIIEAVLDLFVTLPAGVDAGIFSEFQKNIIAEYPIKNERFHLTGSFGIQDGKVVPPSAKSQTDGFIFRNDTTGKIVQTRLDGFTFNKLKPYSCFEDLLTDAMPLWGQYKKLVKPQKITRMALRFINNIELPLPVVDLKEYFITRPEIAPGIPPSIKTFFFAVVLVDPATGTEANVIQTVGDPTENKIPFIFDITVSRNLMINPDDDAEIKKVLDHLRSFKNQIFNNSLTNRTKEMFQ